MRGVTAPRAEAGVHTDGCVCVDCRDERAETDWDAYRQCPVCRRPTGQACVALSGRVAGGRPDGQLTELEVPHAGRRRRRRR
jgi:hypothetical protein